MRLFYFHAVPFVEQTLFNLVEELGSLLIGKCFDFYNFPFLDVDSKWCKYGLKAQKLLAQGIALGTMTIRKAPCKGKSLINC